ncbi:hypothetical protein B0H13DRAFT_1637194, partial [Mycena leptocephala]
LMRQMINSMSTKMEIGSPMASMYLLGNPDHYTSHTFVNFSWRTYVTFVKKYWYASPGETVDDTEEIADDMMTLQNQDGEIVAISIVDDYSMRPRAYESVTLYEWIQCHEEKARTKQERETFLTELEERENWKELLAEYENIDLTWHSFQEHHQQYRSHHVHCDFRKLDNKVPNFIGGAIPRADRGDREY